MDDMLRGTAGNITEAMRTISALNTKLNEATADLAMWKMNIQGEVDSTKEGFVVKLRISKPNGQGLFKTITPEQIAYYVDDPEPLIESLIEEVVLLLFKKQLHNEISPVLTRGLRNAHMMELKA